jgi:flavorubredoxin
MAQGDAARILWEGGGHAVAWLGAGNPEIEKGIPSAQYAVLDGACVTLIDPGGYHVFDRVHENLARIAPLDRVAVLDVFLTHQDPDVAASIASWLELRPDARVIVSALWERFLPHFGVPILPNVIALPDEGAELPRAGKRSLHAIPAHFLHSPGNFSLWDPTSHTLFSGDIGAATTHLGEPALHGPETDAPFDARCEAMLAFHQRYMASNAAVRRWVARVRGLDIAMMCPQHGPIFRGDDVGRFFDWLLSLNVGIDALGA